MAERPNPLRICIIGNSGSGKSTFARALAAAIHIPSVELDSIFHQPGWTQLEPEEFRARVAQRLDAAVAEHGGWVVDGNYARHVLDLTIDVADVVVWFDLPRPRVMWQLGKRTLRRVSTKQELWNGNTERWRNLIKWAPEENILRWAWTQHAAYFERFSSLAADSDARWLRVRNPRERDAALATLIRDYAAG